MTQYSIIDRSISEETRKILDRDCAEFYFSQAEKKLEDTIRTGTVITDRAYAFNGMMLTIFIALCGMTGSLLVAEKINIWLLLYCLEGIVVCGVSLILVFKKVMFPHCYYPLGRSPKVLKIDEFVKYYNETKKPVLVNIIADELSVIQKRIEANKEFNDTRAHYAGIAMKIVLYGVYMIMATLFINGVAKFVTL